MQWNATGKLTTKAMLPLQRWTNESAGPRDLIGSRPHMTSAVASCTNARTRTIVASQAFICRTPEKPRVNTGRPAASCTRAYTPRQTATIAPAKMATVTPPRARRGRSATAVAIRPPSCRLLQQMIKQESLCTGGSTKQPLQLFFLFFRGRRLEVVLAQPAFPELVAGRVTHAECGYQDQYGCGHTYRD